MAIIALLPFVGLWGCSESPKRPSSKTIIKGRIVSKTAQKIYLKKIDNFNYLQNDYILDSVVLDDTGRFEFILRDSTRHLFGLSTHGMLPTTYVVLREAPQLYFFGSCSNFFASEPVFFLNSGDSLALTWYDNRIVDSIVHITENGKFQDTFRDFYLTKARQLDIYENVAATVNPLEVWERASSQRDRLLDVLVRDPKHIAPDGLDNYFYTEVVLSTLNLFLNWYEDTHFEEVLDALLSNNPNHFYNGLFATYASHEWHPESFEFYKMTERCVNHGMNQKNGEFVNYHLPSDEKLKTALDVLGGKNLSRYTRMLEAQIAWTR